MITINEDESTLTNDEESTSMSTSRPGVAPGTRSMSVTGCEDTIIANDKDTYGYHFKFGKLIKIATWNCGGLSYTTRELCRDLSYDILVLTETHNKGSLRGSRNFVTSESAPNDDSYSGVVIMLSDRIAKCVSHGGSCGLRIVYAEIKAQPCNLFVIGVYMPQKMGKNKPFAADTLKQLEQIISKISPRTCVLLLGDLNCKLGRSVDNLTGMWCAHKTPNAEDKCFLDMMQRLILRAMSTYFQSHKRKSNATYLAKNPAYKPSQIDYSLISARWAISEIARLNGASLANAGAGTTITDLWSVC